MPAALAIGFLTAMPSPAAAFLFEMRPRAPLAQDYRRPYLPPRRLERPARPRAAVRKRGSERDKVAEKAKDSLKSTQGPFHVVVSIDDQRLTLYARGVAVAHSPVSTGVPGHPTPTGVFSVIQKRRIHHSNIYSGAPMPYMQRITWSGIALHAGVVPGRPASHGCIRLPSAFAARLWDVTKIGARVIVARKQPALTEFTHPRLFAWKPAPLDVLEPADLAAQVEKSVNEAVFAATAEMLGERQSEDVEASAARAASEPMRRLRTAEAELIMTDGVDREPPSLRIAALAPSEMKPSQPTLRRGPVSIFISRKERKLYVRKGHAPVFEAPVAIFDPDRPIGTHVFTAMDFQSGGAAMSWTVMSVPSSSRMSMAEVPLRGSLKPRSVGGRSQPRPAAGTDSLPVSLSPTPSEALERVNIPKDAADRISEMMSPGASLIISDNGIGGETGQDTDFIVLTR